MRGRVDGTERRPQLLSVPFSLTANPLGIMFSLVRPICAPQTFGVVCKECAPKGTGDCDGGFHPPYGSPSPPLHIPPALPRSARGGASPSFDGLGAGGLDGGLAGERVV